MSVDGFIADKDGYMDWMIWDYGAEWAWDDKLQKYFNDLTASIDCILLSRNMAEQGYIAHWAKVAENPEDPQSGFAKIVTDAHKIVFSKKLRKSKWPNTEIAGEGLAVAVNKLKKQNGKDIMVYGGATLVSSLIKAGLIDEYNLVINPTALGNGLPIFAESESKLNLTLAKSTGYACGVVVLTYVPKMS